MAYAGQTIENPVSGGRITFRKTAADTNGELLEIDVEPKPLDLALFVHEFKDEVRGPASPGWAQRAALAPLAWIARRRGRAERYVSPRPAYA